MRWFQAARNLHENTQVIEFTSTTVGRILMWLAASALLVWHGVTLLAPLAIGLIIISPHQRRLILSLAAIGMILDRYLERQQVSFTLSSVSAPLEISDPLIKTVTFSTSILIGLYLVFLSVKHLHRFPESARRFPLLLLHFGVAAGFVIMNIFPGLAAAAELVPWLIWRLCYLIQYGTRGGVAATKFSDHLFYLWPIVGDHGNPIGKGLGYLSSHEAKNVISFASSQLAGLKLLFLAMLWEIVLQALEEFVFETGAAAGNSLTDWNLGLPTLAQAMASESIGLVTAWVTIFIELIRIVLDYAVTGHIIVGLLRLCGFHIFRNTYKPLLSESIVDFWGRFNFYFKELMVEFFFYPTFLSLRRVNVQLRLFCAVFAAAFFGNMYYHVLETPVLIATNSYDVLWEVWGPRLVYCFLLSIGIWVSMLRQQSVRKQPADKSVAVRIRSIAGVWVFYALIHIWNLYAEGLTWEDRFEFCLKLAGVQLG